MDNKQILIVAGSLIGGLLIVAGLVFGVYQYDRTILGLPPAPIDTTAKVEPIIVDTTPPRPKLELFKEDFDYLQDALILKELYRFDSDTLGKQVRTLTDSVNSLVTMKYYVEDSLRRSRDEVSRLISFHPEQVFLDSIGKLNALIQSHQSTIRMLQAEAEEQKKLAQRRNDTIANLNTEAFSKIMNSSNAVAVAGILQNLEPREAAKMLKLMQKKKAAKVLDAMPAEKARMIIQQGGAQGIPIQ